MELKRNTFAIVGQPSDSLNRTFYGIETTLNVTNNTNAAVLIVPFMELKRACPPAQRTGSARLNRTFYGIETHHHRPPYPPALCLNRTFYGIETILIWFVLS